MRTQQIKRQKSAQNEGVNKIETHFFDLNTQSNAKPKHKKGDRLALLAVLLETKNQKIQQNIMHRIQTSQLKNLHLPHPHPPHLHRHLHPRPHPHPHLRHRHPPNRQLHPAYPGTQ